MTVWPITPAVRKVLRGPRPHSPCVLWSGSLPIRHDCCQSAARSVPAHLLSGSERLAESLLSEPLKNCPPVSVSEVDEPPYGGCQLQLVLDHARGVRATGRISGIA